MSFCLAQLLVACNQHVADDFQSLARAAFLRTLKHVRTDSCKSRLVLKALALLTGEYFLGLPFFEKATSGDSHSAHEQGIDEAMVLAVSETWACHFQNLNTCKLSNSSRISNLKKVNFN